MKVCHDFLLLFAYTHSLTSLFFNFLLYLKGLMAGTVTLDENGGFVASQMWEVVSAVISYSYDLMNESFVTVGAQQDEVRPFCRSFSSISDLIDEFIRYPSAHIQI